MKTPNPNPRKKRSLKIDRSYVIVASMIAVGVLLAFTAKLTSVSAREEEAYKTGRDRIGNMSADERERLKLKAKLFLDKFDDKKRQSYRKLHSQLEDDENSESLKKTLGRYNAWLATLSPYRREELREKLSKAPSPKEQREVIVEAQKKQEYDKWYRSLSDRDRGRLRFVKDDPVRRESLEMEIRAEQERRAATGESVSPPVRRSRSRSGSGSSLRLNSETLEAILQEVAAKLNVPKTTKHTWETMPDFRRHINILHAAVKQCREPKGVPNPSFLNDASLKSMVIKSSLDSQSISRIIGYVDGRSQRWGILKILVGSTMSEMFSGRKKPTEEELSKFLEEMDAKNRAQIMRFRGDELKRWLEFKFNQKLREGSHQEMREFLKSLNDLPEWKWGQRSQGGSRSGPGNRTGRKPTRGGEGRRSGTRKTQEGGKPRGSRG